MPSIILDKGSAEAAASDLYSISGQLDGISSELSNGINTIRSARGSEELSINTAGILDAPSEAQSEICSVANEIRAKIMTVEAYAADDSRAAAAAFLSSAKGSVNQNSTSHIAKPKTTKTKSTKKSKELITTDKKMKTPSNVDFNRFSVSQPIETLGNSEEKRKISRERIMAARKSRKEKERKAEEAKKRSEQSIAGSSVLVGPSTKIYSDNKKTTSKNTSTKTSSGTSTGGSTFSSGGGGGGGAAIASAGVASKSIATPKKNTTSSKSKEKATTTTKATKATKTKKSQTNKEKKATTTTKNTTNTSKNNKTTSNNATTTKKATTTMKSTSNSSTENRKTDTTKNATNNVTITKPASDLNNTSNIVSPGKSDLFANNKTQPTSKSANKVSSTGNASKSSTGILQTPTKVVKDTLSKTINNVTDSTIGEVIKKGISYDKIPTASIPIQTLSSSGSSVVPAVAGLGAATTAGIGAKVYLDRKANSVNDYSDDSESEKDDLVTENMNDNEKYDIDYTDGMDKEENLEDTSSFY